MIWSTSDLILETKEVNINPRVMADHNPIEWEIHTKTRKRIWRLNNVYWQDEKFKSQIKEEMKEFYEINLNGEVDTNIVWDTGKGGMRD